MLLNDNRIGHLCLAQQMITPFVDHLVRENDNGQKVISYGLSSCGYDIRLAPTSLYRSNLLEMCIDREIDVEGIDRLGYIASRNLVNPKNIKEDDFILCDPIRDKWGSFIAMEPGQVVLGHSLETFNMPSNVVGIAYGKSTYARSGLHVLVTPLEPGWRGQLVVEIANVSSNSVRLYLNEGIAQIQFSQIEQPLVTYADRGGKYQDQTGTTLSKV